MQNEALENNLIFISVNFVLLHIHVIRKLETRKYIFK